MDELKPCPFCGGKGEIYERTECYGHGDYGTETYVRCKSCGARGKTISDHEIWNDRVRKLNACQAWNERCSNG